MRLKHVFAALLFLCLLAQHTRLREAEAQLAVLADTVQRQELRMKQLAADMEALQNPGQEGQQPLTELIQQYVGYFDDHDVSGLLEEE